MERIINLTIEKLPEGAYLGTSDDVQGLVVQGNTIAEVIEFAQDAARVIEEMRAEYGDPLISIPAPQMFTIPIVLAGPTKLAA